MANCTKCGAELIGAKKFCIACGAPAVDPATLKRDAGSAVKNSPSSPAPVPQINVPPASSYGPPSQVNPFAATASPSSRAVGSPYGPPPAPIAPPPPTTAQPPSGIAADGTGPQPPQPGMHGPQVSPLAVSNALSQRGAFQEAAGVAVDNAAKRGNTSPPPPAAGGPGNAQPQRAPGTQLMPSMQNPPAPSAGGRPGSAPPAAGAPSKRPDRTQLMDPSSFVRPKPGAAPQSQPGVPGSSPGPLHQPASVAQPSIQQPPMPSGQPPMMQHGTPQQAMPPPMQPQQPPPQQWGGPASAWAPPTPSFGFAPGARVNVTWSNGQRYPATVSQVSGTKVLVVFPDGQQHWVEMQYLTPG